MVAKTENIQERLRRRMLNAAKQEEYEVAQSYKVSIDHLELKSKWLKEIKKPDITIKEYEKHMTIGQVLI
jgi:hypothetical protein